MTTEKRAANAGTVVLVNGETMGRGDDRLGATVLGNFLRSLATIEPKPDAVVFVNAAVKLLGPGSQSLEALGVLDDAGVDILACATCVDFFGLTRDLKVGRATQMRDIVQRMMSAWKVIGV